MPPFEWVYWPFHQQLLAILSKGGGEARFVGGAVRNTLLGQTPDDFDLATTHPPEEVLRRLQAAGITAIPTGLQHGTVTAVHPPHHYEITTLRRDTHTDGRWATVVYTDSWQEDAQRRDFTMNALYVDADGKLYDYFGGQQDIQERIVRFIGNPIQRIKEDFLRILRFFRMHAYYGRTFDAPSLQAACTLKASLDSLSGERITKEVLKLLDAPWPWTVIHTMKEKGFFPLILGQEAPRPLFPTLAFAERFLGQRVSPWARLISLSPPPYPRLVLSRQQHKMLAVLATPFSEEQLSTYIDSAYETSRATAHERVILGGCRHLAVYPAEMWAQQAPLFLPLDTLHTLQQLDLPLFPLTGADLIAYGLQGPEIGYWLRQLRLWWIQHGFRPTPTECLHYLSTQRTPFS